MLGSLRGCQVRNLKAKTPEVAEKALAMVKGRILSTETVVKVMMGAVDDPIKVPLEPSWRILPLPPLSPPFQTLPA